MASKLRAKEPTKSYLHPDAPKVLADKCKKCGLCLTLCPGNVFEKHYDTVTAMYPDSCIHCGHCGAICPAKAIVVSSIEPKPLTAADMRSLPSPESLQLLFRSRRSIRQFKRQPLKREDLQKILDAGRYTPTGTNSQGIRYIVITDRRKIEELEKMVLPNIMKTFSRAERIASLPFASYLLGDDLAYNLKNIYGPGMKKFYERQKRGEDRLYFNAPALMLVHGEGFDESLAFSCPVALYNCSLMAHSLGVGCCLNGFTVTAVNSEPKLKKYFDFPRTHKCFGAMILGYQDVKYKHLVKRNPPDVKWM